MLTQGVNVTFKSGCIVQFCFSFEPVPPTPILWTTLLNVFAVADQLYINTISHRESSNYYILLPFDQNFVFSGHGSGSGINR